MNSRFRANQAFVPSASGADTIRFFAIHEERRIESAQVVPYFAADQEETAADDVNLPHVVAEPRTIPLLRETLRERGNSLVSPTAMQKTLHGVGRAQHEAGVQAPVGEDGSPAENRRLRVRVGKRDEPLDLAVEDDRVGVE